MQDNEKSRIQKQLISFTHDIAPEGEETQQHCEQQTDCEGQDTAHQAVNDPRSRAQPRRGQGPDDLTQHNHLRQVDAEGAPAQEGPPQGGGRTGRAVITRRGEPLHDDKQQGGHGDVVDADVVSNRVDVLLPSNVKMVLHQELEQRHYHDAEEEEQRPFPAVLQRENGQAVMVDIVTQQHVAIVVSKRAEHVVAILQRLDEHAVLIGDER